MKILYFTCIFLVSNYSWALTPKWNCENLSLKFNEIPNSPGVEFSVHGCWQSDTYFLISDDCKADPKKCLELGKSKKVKHPGGGIGSPAFAQCYQVGGRPRFLQLKIKDKWENTSTCFFGSEKSFLDYDTILEIKKNK